MQHANGVRYIQVTKYGEIQLKARIFCAGTDALSLCSPTALMVGRTPKSKQRWRSRDFLLVLISNG